MKIAFLLRLACVLIALCQQVATADEKPNMLTAAEQRAGWNLLFDGKDFDGWHNFKVNDVRPGWQIKDGALACVDPHNAGNIVTSNQFQ